MTSYNLVTIYNLDTSSDLDNSYDLDTHQSRTRLQACPALKSSVKRDLIQCQKRPTTVSKETYYSVKRDLIHSRMATGPASSRRLVYAAPRAHDVRGNPHRLACARRPPPVGVGHRVLVVLCAARACGGLLVHVEAVDA